MNGKFRVWNGEYFEIDSFVMFQDGKLARVWADNTISLINQQEYFTSQFFTGLQDKNKKDIYFGDIVRCNVLLSTPCSNYPINPTGEVIFYEGVVMVDTPFVRIKGYSLFGMEPEIIGNIFENPELLENKE